MTYRRSRAEIAFSNSLVTTLEKPSKLFERIKYWHPVGPWTVSVFTPDTRGLIGRRHFGVHEEASLQQWFSQLQLHFNFVQWFVASGKDAKSCRPI
jgi:hypothetical protein